MWGYIWYFSRKCHELLKICDADVISAFWSVTNYGTLVHELCHDQPKTMKELLDITTRHASGKEAARAVFIQNSGKVAPGKGVKRGTKSNKRGPKRRPQWVMITTSYDKGDNDKDVGDSDEELIAAAECDFKLLARQPANHFEKLLEATCPNHTYPIRHKLKDAPWWRTTWPRRLLPRARCPKMTQQVKLSPLPRREGDHVNLWWTCPPWVSEYLRWSESPITFDWTDHLDSVPKLGRFPLIVNPLVGMTRLIEALMDGGSDLNLMYLDTFEGLGLTRN
jgi:hypothetical protein